MRARQAGLAVALVHVALVGTVGLKLMADRARLPRAWVRSAPYDPSLPIRGRYVRLRLEIPLNGAGAETSRETNRGVRLSIADGRLMGTVDDTVAERRVTVQPRDSAMVGVLDEPVAFFIPEHVPDPSIRPPGEQLWAEVTVPRRGPARPIRLGILKNGVLTPLPIR